MCSTSSLSSEHNHYDATMSSSSRKPPLRRSSSVTEATVQVTTGSVLSVAVLLFSLYLPFLLAPHAASKTYHFAFYEYDPDTSHFDNTLWTYATDYLLAIAMGVLASHIATSHTVTRTHAWRSRGLLICYLLSVFAGGLAHQFYTTLEHRNTASFRFLWTICVGSVTAASAFMGAIGTELVRMDQALQPNSYIPILPEWFWTGFGICTTAVCVAGGLSFQRPACDIFVAGITQFPSTAYVITILTGGLVGSPVPQWARLVGIGGFILNAPLLPLYPLLVQYTNWSLGAVNTLLHTWLLVAWGMQGIALRKVEQAMAAQFGPPTSAVPIRKKEW